MLRVLALLTAAVSALLGLPSALLLEPDRVFEAAGDPERDPKKLPGYPAYVRQCSTCHGEEGDGAGIGARFLDPPPRDFTFGRFRFTSTENDVPSGKDVYEVVAAGLAGTSMLPFAHLGDEELWALVDVVLAFRTRGLAAVLRRAGMEGDRFKTTLESRTRPVLPPDPAPEPPETIESAARGLIHYRAHCAKCHDADGRGVEAPPMKAEEGHPVRATDLSKGVSKQSPIKKNRFARIRFGLPGSSMPAIGRDVLDDAGVWEIVHYLKTLSNPEAQLLADAAARPVASARLVGAPPASPDDPRFAQKPATWVPFVPFRAGEATTPGVFVQSLIGSEEAWFRLVYPDATENGATAAETRRRSPPDGIAVRVTGVRNPPVLPFPGQPPPVDRALSLRGPMPSREDPIFDATPRFANPDRVCIGVFRPDHVGEAVYRGGAWHVVVGVRLVESGDPAKVRLSASFAAFDGALHRGPMPTAFTHWNPLVL